MRPEGLVMMRQKTEVFSDDETEVLVMMDRSVSDAETEVLVMMRQTCLVMMRDQKTEVFSDDVRRTC